MRNQLDELESQSNELGLKVNTSKSKVMVFRKGGHLAKNEKWTLNGENIEIVNSYRYLGVELSTRLSLSNITASATPKAKKASYDLIRYMKTLQCHNIGIFTKLFASKVQPILLYGSEIWGLYESKDIERVHTFAFKSFLKLPMHSSNYLLYGETGRYPLFLCSIMNAIKYWLKLLKLPRSRLNKQAYLMLVNMLENGHTNWASNIKDILSKNGFGFVWTDQSVSHEKHFLVEFKNRLTDCFIQQWRENLHNRSEFKLYRSIKTTFGTEKYISNVPILSFRNALVRLRLCASPILCHANRFLPDNSNLCPLCNEIEEDELHFILGCHRLEDIRMNILPNYCLTNRHSTTLADLLSKEKHSFYVGKYIFQALKRRDTLTQNQQVLY